MGTITPNSNIILLKGVPLNNNYNESVYWSSQQAITGQVAGFMTYPNMTITQHMYQRLRDGVIRVNLLADLLYDYNYMLFKNVGYIDNHAVNYQDKWYFAFINNVEYVNEQACNVYYEIDEIQTWWFDAILNPCFVEREHSVTDVIGEHTLAEPIDTGLIVCTEDINPLDNFDMTNSKIIVFAIPSTAAAENPEDAYGIHSGYLVDGIYSGCVPLVYEADISGVMDLNEFLEKLIDGNAIDTIVSITQFPKGFTPQIQGGTVVVNSEEQKFDVQRPTTIDGYTPKNNKLFTAPYIYFNVDVQSDSRAYRYELFNSPIVDHPRQFYCIPCITPVPELIVVPLYYNGCELYNITESITMDGFPQCAFAIDGYRAYLAQKSVDYDFEQMKQGVSIAANTANAMAGAVTENPVMMAQGTIGALQGIIGAGQAYYDNVCENNKGSTTKGGHDSSASLGHGFRKIRVRKMSIKAETARMIDDFFSRYGYACQCIKVPNRNVRQNWTFTKTNNASIIGNIPTASLHKIINIYNNGITFFNNIHNVGNYGLSNNPL